MLELAAEAGQAEGAAEEALASGPPLDGEVAAEYLRVVADGATHGLHVRVRPLGAPKCPRCWRHVPADALGRGEGVDEVGYDKANPARELVKIDPKYFRPTEVELLIGDPTKAKQKLGWTPKIKMEALCREMVEADIKLVEKGDLTS